jgi:hypothetical protein
MIYRYLRRQLPKIVDPTRFGGRLRFELGRLDLNEFIRIKDTPLQNAGFGVRRLPMADLAEMPRRIYLYWDKGFDQAPDVVRLCAKSWQVLNPGWEVTLLDATAAQEIVDRTALPQDIREAHYSDILRTRLLTQHGGVWADATLLALRPLDDWLLQIMTQTRFFAFSRETRDRILANWFLASRRDDPVIAAIDGTLQQFWRGDHNELAPYFFYHFLVEFLHRTDRRFARAWSDMPVLNSHPMLLMFLVHKYGKDIGPHIDLIRSMPMQKLSHKIRIDMAQLERDVQLIAPDLAERLF